MKRGMKLPMRLKATDVRNWASTDALRVSVKTSLTSVRVGARNHGRLRTNSPTTEAQRFKRNHFIPITFPTPSGTLKPVFLFLRYASDGGNH